MTDLRALRDNPMGLLQAIEKRVLDVGGQMVAGQDAWAGVTVRVGEDRFLIPQDQVREVVELPGYSRVPGARAWLLGVSNVRGELVPVVNLKSLLFDEATSIDLNSRIVVVKHDKAAIGFLVDRVEGLRRFDDSQKMSSASGHLAEACSQFVNGAYGDEENPLPVLDMFKLIDDPIFKMAA